MIVCLFLYLFLVDPAITDREGKNSLHYAFEHGAPTSLFEKIKDKYVHTFYYCPTLRSIIV